MRLLVTGSRDWDKPDVVWGALDIIARETAAIGDELTVVHGACFPRRRGPDGRFPLESADYLADLWCRREHPCPVTPERHPANWKVHKRGAGQIRNREMVNLGADLALAFLRDDSPGTTKCIEFAERAGITVQVLDYDSLPERVT
jgi:hypothetical protein